MLAACSGSDAPSAELPPALGVRRVPPAYRIVYRVEDHAGRQVSVSTERLVVRRPFDAWRESAPGESGRQPAQQVDVHVLGGHQTGGSQQPFVLPAEPGPPAPDLRPGPALRELARRGVLERRGRRRVIGRECDVYRTGSPADAGAVVPATEPGDHADICLDAAGLVLDERWISDGELLRRRTAVDVDEDPAIDDALFTLGGSPMAPQQGGGAVQRVTGDSRPPETDFWELERPPEGFEHLDRFLVVLAQAQPTTDAPGPSRVASVADVYVRGLDVLVVDNGGTLYGDAPFDTDPHGRPVRLGALGRGEAILDLRASEVRVRLDGGRFVRVYGTLSIDQLTDVARRLQRRDGGTLTTIPG